MSRPSELDDALYARIARLSDIGNASMDAGAFGQAISVFTSAFELLPEPRMEWDAGEWLGVAIADAQFQLGRFAEASEWLFDVLCYPERFANPFIALRLGQSLFEVGNVERATEHLMRAYMTGGEDLFEDEDPKFLEHLRARGLV